MNRSCFEKQGGTCLALFKIPIWPFEGKKKKSWSTFRERCEAASQQTHLPWIQTMPQDSASRMQMGPWAKWGTQYKSAGVGGWGVGRAGCEERAPGLKPAPESGPNSVPFPTIWPQASHLAPLALRLNTYVCDRGYVLPVTDWTYMIRSLTLSVLMSQWA